MCHRSPPLYEMTTCAGLASDGKHAPKCNLVPALITSDVAMTCALKEQIGLVVNEVAMQNHTWSLECCIHGNKLV